MKRFLNKFLDSDDIEHIDAVHQDQKSRYGVCIPPSLKQLIYLRNILMTLGNFKELQAEDFLGLTKIECKILLQKLNRIYIYKRVYKKKCV